MPIGIQLSGESPRSPLVTEQLYFQQKEHLSYHEYQVNQTSLIMSTRSIETMAGKICDKDESNSGWLLRQMSQEFGVLLDQSYTSCRILGYGRQGRQTSIKYRTGEGGGSGAALGRRRAL